MNKIKIIGTLICLFITGCSCSYKKSRITEANRKDIYEIHSGVEPESGIEGNPQIAYQNLCSLANKQLIENKNLNSSLEYVDGLSSIEFTTNKVVYCAVGNKQDEYNYMVKITMSHNFDNADAFVYQMTNLNLNTAVTTYGVSTEVSDIYSSETINDKFDDKASSTLPYFDSANVYIHNAYKPNNEDNVYFSVTYLDYNGLIHSSNEIQYVDYMMDFYVNSIFEINESSSSSMYKLLSIILA